MQVYIFSQYFLQGSAIKILNTFTRSLFSLYAGHWHSARLAGTNAFSQPLQQLTHKVLLFIRKSCVSTHCSVLNLFTTPLSLLFLVFVPHGPTFDFYSLSFQLDACQSSFHSSCVLFCMSEYHTQICVAHANIFLLQLRCCAC